MIFKPKVELQAQAQVDQGAGAALPLEEIWVGEAIYQPDQDFEGVEVGQEEAAVGDDDFFRQMQAGGSTPATASSSDSSDIENYSWCSFSPLHYICEHFMY